MKSNELKFQCPNCGSRDVYVGEVVEHWHRVYYAYSRCKTCKDYMEAPKAITELGDQRAWLIGKLTRESRLKEEKQ